MKDRNIIYHENCGCIYSGECNFRYFSIIDPSCGEYKTIAICGDFIRQKIQELKYDFERFERWAYQKTKFTKRIYHRSLRIGYDYYSIVVEVILSNHYSNIIEYHYDGKTFGNNIESRRFMITICTAPWIYTETSIPSAIKHYVESAFDNTHLLNDIIYEVERYLKNIRYKKYKNKHRETIRILRIIENTYKKEDKDLLWIDLINELFRETTSAQKLTT